MKDKGTYMLKKLNRLRLSGIVANDKLKRFHPQQRLQLDYAPNLDYEELSNLDNFFLSNGNNKLFDIPNNIFNL